jgi:hypothetical protein
VAFPEIPKALIGLVLWPGPQKASAHHSSNQLDVLVQNHYLSAEEMDKVGRWYAARHQIASAKLSNAYILADSGTDLMSKRR